MRFLKLELTWATSPWLIVLSAEARLSWVMLLGYTKASGLNGRVKRIDALTASRLWFVGEESVRQMERAAVNDGALIIEDGEWIVKNWARYQGDETAAERQRRFREVRKVEESNGRNALRNGSNGEEKRREEKRKELPPKSPKGEMPLGDLLTAEFPTLVGHLPAIEEWLTYKAERKQSYKPMGLKALLRTLEKLPNPTRAIRHSMANNWSGVFDAESKQAPTQNQVAPRAAASPTDEQLQKVRR